VDKAFIPALTVVVDEYEFGERLVPEMLLSVRIVKDAMNVLSTMMSTADMILKGCATIGTV